MLEKIREMIKQGYKMDQQALIPHLKKVIRNRRGRKKMGFIAVVIVFASLGYDMYSVIRSHGNN